MEDLKNVTEAVALAVKYILRHHDGEYPLHKTVLYLSELGYSQEHISYALLVLLEYNRIEIEGFATDNMILRLGPASTDT